MIWSFNHFETILFTIFITATCPNIFPGDSKLLSRNDFIHTVRGHEKCTIITRSTDLCIGRRSVRRNVSSGLEFFMKLHLIFYQIKMNLFYWFRLRGDMGCFIEIVYGHKNKLLGSINYLYKPYNYISYIENHFPNYTQYGFCPKLYATWITLIFVEIVEIASSTNWEELMIFLNLFIILCKCFFMVIVLIDNNMQKALCICIC